jgi:hypothetical protein
MSDRDPIVSEWRGEPTYGCPICAFDTHSEEGITDHLRGAHPVPEGADPVEAAEEVTEPEPDPAAETASEPELVEEPPVSTPAPEPPVVEEPEPQAAQNDDDEE